MIAGERSSPKALERQFIESRGREKVGPFGYLKEAPFSRAADP